MNLNSNVFIRINGDTFEISPEKIGSLKPKFSIFGRRFILEDTGEIKHELKYTEIVKAIMKLNKSTNITEDQKKEYHKILSDLKEKGYLDLKNKDGEFALAGKYGKMSELTRSIIVIKRWWGESEKFENFQELENLKWNKPIVDTSGKESDHTQDFLPNPDESGTEATNSQGDKDSVQGDPVAKKVGIDQKGNDPSSNDVESPKYLFKIDNKGNTRAILCNQIDKNKNFFTGLEKSGDPNEKEILIEIPSAFQNIKISPKIKELFVEALATGKEWKCEGVISSEDCLSLLLLADHYKVDWLHEVIAEKIKHISPSWSFERVKKFYCDFTLVMGGAELLNSEGLNESLNVKIYDHCCNLLLNFIVKDYLEGDGKSTYKENMERYLHRLLIVATDNKDKKFRDLITSFCSELITKNLINVLTYRESKIPKILQDYDPSFKSRLEYWCESVVKNYTYGCALSEIKPALKYALKYNDSDLYGRILRRTSSINDSFELYDNSYEYKKMLMKYAKKHQLLDLYVTLLPSTRIRDNLQPGFCIDGNHHRDLDEILKISKYMNKRKIIPSTFELVVRISFSKIKDLVDLNIFPVVDIQYGDLCKSFCKSIGKSINNAESIVTTLRLSSGGYFSAISRQLKGSKLKNLDILINSSADKLIDSKFFKSFENLLNSNTFLKSLKLSNQKKISKETAIKLGDALKSNTTLEELDIRSLYFESEEAYSAFFDRLILNTNLKKVIATQAGAVYGVDFTKIHDQYKASHPGVMSITKY